MTEKQFQHLPRHILKAILGATLLLGPLVFGVLGLSLWWIVPLAIIGGLLARDDIAKFIPDYDLIASYGISMLCFGVGALILYFIGWCVRWLFGLV